jgi:hypothetical protein
MLAGYGRPWAMTVDSRATTGRCSCKAVCTSSDRVRYVDGCIVFPFVVEGSGMRLACAMGYVKIDKKYHWVTEGIEKIDFEVYVFEEEELVS